MNRKTLFGKLIVIFLLVKLSYLFLGMTLSELFPSFPSYSFNTDSYIKLSMQKDAYWYKSIAENGYPLGEFESDGTRLINFTKKQSAWAFFPAYPLFNKSISKAFSVQYETSALISSFIFSFFALFGYFLFCKNYWNSSIRAFWSSLIFFLFPFHFYFSMFLSEAPFFAFLIWCFYFTQKNYLIPSALTLSILVLIRPNGILLLLPVFMYYIEKQGLLSSNSFNWKHFLPPLYMCLPAAFMFIGYLFYQNEMTGHYLAFSEAQKGWGKEFMFPLFALFQKGDLNYQVTSFYTIFVFSLLIFMRKKLPWSLILLVFICLILPLSAGSTYSMIRYGSVIFPIFLLVSELFFQVKNKTRLICFLSVIHLTSFYFWLSNHPLGF